MRLLLSLCLLVTAGLAAASLASYLSVLAAERLVPPRSPVASGSQAPLGELFASSAGAACGFGLFLLGIALQVARGRGSTVRLFAEEDYEDAFDGLRQLGLVVAAASLAGGVAGALWALP